MKTIFLLVIMMFAQTCLAKKYSANVLDRVNEMRAEEGLPVFLPDENLQEEAEEISMIRASEGQNGHLRNNQWKFARAEGVGWYPRKDFKGIYFITCYLYTRKYKYAGAGLAVRDNGITYYTLRLR